MSSLKRNLPPLNSVVAFEAAARLGSFSDAARELNVTREAVSRQIRSLETYLGISLFERGANHTQLRGWGQKYFEAVSAGLESIALTTQLICGGPEAAGASGPPDALDDSPRAERAKIVIVDDMPANIHRLNDVLRAAYDVVAHTSSEDTLEWLAAGGSADLALLDVHMAGLDGYGLCRRLKAVPAHARMPVIFLTSLDAPQDETEGFAAGACDYISRPFAPAVLLARIEVQLELRRAQTALETLLERRADRLEQAEALLRDIQGRIGSFQE